MASTIEAQQAIALGSEFNHRPGLYQETRCVHSAALADREKVLYFAEDIGRHNAVDKVVGRAFAAGDLLSELILLCTGRFSFDMVAKAARVRIPIVVSPAAATHEATQLAQRFHITLCGRVRRTSMTIYTCPWRITGQEAAGREE
jgi:FdhD protein